MRQNGRIYPTGNTGKNTFEEVLGRGLLNNENYFRTASTQQLFGRFNKAMASNLLTVGQEIVSNHNYMFLILLGTHHYHLKEMCLY